MGIRPALHPTVVRGKTCLPSACFSMTRSEKQNFCKVLSRVKVPDGYSSNISRCVKVKNHKIYGLKSHDCHILMQQLLPLAIRRTLPKKVSSVLVELSKFFRELCTKVGSVEEYGKLKAQIAITLRHLERIFPPSFFDIMVHLPIHLADEAKVAGPVQYRWMYPIERFRIKDIDIRSKTQNSGVVVTAKTSSFASSKDKNPIVGDVSYFGNVVDVVELDYYGGRKVALFKCDWIDINSNRGTKKDELGFTLVNPSCLLKTEEPFILASQAIQVFYVEDPVETDWHAVVFTKPRDLYDMDEVANVGDLLMEDNTTNLQQFMDNEDDVRDNVPEIMLNSPVNIIDVGAENNESDDEDDDEYDN
ncbi:hypothetical protein LWI29_018024 [Acer saccharum]|uniref:DUF4216 domain-containing protein n=1 Tax=Acer saccharum TaxID=4024 RepID=A0AA39T0D7_ACESA|nr:hypothetical protein LWI29_018024 [Acer saccharum]